MTEDKNGYDDDDDGKDGLVSGLDKVFDQETGLLYLFGPISIENVFPCINTILSVNLSPKYGNLSFLTLIINSAGGNLDDAFALIDVMEGSRVPIRTVGLGMIASAALMIFMSGRKGYRTLSPNTSILSHQWSCGVYGKRHELVSVQNQFDIIDKKVYNLYKSKTKLSKTNIYKTLLPPSDVWLTAEEALDYGICDKIAKINNQLITG